MEEQPKEDWSAHAIVHNPSKTKFLMVMESERKDPKWKLAGGRRFGRIEAEENEGVPDVSPIETMRRELLEETGITHSERRDETILFVNDKGDHDQYIFDIVVEKPERFRGHRRGLPPDLEHVEVFSLEGLAAMGPELLLETHRRILERAGYLTPRRAHSLRLVTSDGIKRSA